MTLAERMIKYRACERINQRELAERCGLSLQTINSVENETQTPSKMTMAKIELVIGQERFDKEGI
ncbi:MAG: helix-turn-helix transcriptional regulator [Clostridia bacterium]|nr:helix-turn-helix transcriptional regulator [Clostridia bacterium]